MLVINKWYGRLGNNMLQILRAIYYAHIHGHNLIKFPQHPLLEDVKINLTEENDSAKTISSTFFYLKDFQMVDPEPYVLREYFQKHVASIFKIKPSKVDTSTLYFHIRGGDCFSHRPHELYVQPPLQYYKQVIEKSNYKKIILVCEDSKNPCIEKLLLLKDVTYTSNHIEKDLTILASVSELGIGFGTFGLLLYFMNPRLKKLYIPKYVNDFFITGSNWGDVEVCVVDLPNYIKPGEWKNTIEQRDLMMNWSL